MLEKIHDYEFENVQRLRELYLQNNKISAIANGTFAHLRSLRVLRIDGNQLVNVFVWKMLPSKFIEMNNQQLSLGKNPWSCRCGFLNQMTQFITENVNIVQDMQNIYCVDEESHSKHELDLNSSSACNESSSGLLISNSYVPFMIALLATICLIILCGILFVFREPLRLWLFAHYGVRVFGPPCEDNDKLYDAVFLHSAKDTEYIIKHIANELENSQPIFRVCLQHRDLAEDASYIQLLETICASRKIVILLSRNFLQTEWTRYDVKRAIHESLRGRPHKLVMIEDSDVTLDAENDIELLPYMKTSAVKRIRRNDRQFWDKLRYALPSDDRVIRSNNYTLDHQRPGYQSQTLPHHHTVAMHHERFKHANGNGTMIYHHHHHHRQAPPPAYNPEMDETNYSSATTATPSPRPARRDQFQHPHQMHLIANPQMSPQNHSMSIHRAPSEHIYSSIDSDYGGYDPQHHLLMHAQQQQSNNIHRPIPVWRNSNFIVDSTNTNDGSNPQAPSYLV